MKKVVVILFSLFSLTACQVPTAETLEDPYPPAIKIIAEGKEAIIKPLFFCWTECEADFGERKNFRQIVMKDSIPVSQGGQVSIKIDGKKPNALYYKQIRNQSIYENTVEKKDIKKTSAAITVDSASHSNSDRYILVADWKDNNGKKLIGRVYYTPVKFETP
ncbi:hypothetical protein MKX72_15590 [Priestia sp. FSL R5-0597]|uniref:hypothetical protein n=1 Tax=Priestia TaxID=2800373 RepID=UPI0012B7E9C0|nr:MULTISPECIES: hypothetical protein [Priestia]MBY0074244.1 hypothetical protein [Priestia aryabhattai]MCL6709810.1 hypothetical protein [Pseudomonas sp. R2.Fl]